MQTEKRIKGLCCKNGNVYFLNEDSDHDEIILHYKILVNIPVYQDWRKFIRFDMMENEILLPDYKPAWFNRQYSYYIEKIKSEFRRWKVESR